MIATCDKTSWVRAAGLAALFAWLLLLGQTISHADHLDHADTASHPCVACSIGGPEDDFAPPTNGLDIEAPIPAATLPQLGNVNIPAPVHASKTGARAPPHAQARTLKRG